MSMFKGVLHRSGGFLMSHSRGISSRMLHSNATDPLRREDELKTVRDQLRCNIRDMGLLDEALIHTTYPNRKWSSLVHPYCHCIHSELLPTSKYRQSYKNLKAVGECTLTSELYRHVYYKKVGEYIYDCELYPHLHGKTLPTEQSLVSLEAVCAANISTQKLARTAVRHGLFRFLARNSPKLDQEVEEFTKVDKGEVPYNGNIVKAPKILADIVLSIFGAIHIDSTFGDDVDETLKIMKIVLDPIITLDDMYSSVKRLSNLCHEHGMKLEYKNQKFQTHVRNDRVPGTVMDVNVTRVFINGKCFGSGSSEFVLPAKCYAATEALWNLPNYMLWGSYEKKHEDFDFLVFL